MPERGEIDGLVVIIDSSAQGVPRDSVVATAAQEISEEYRAFVVVSELSDGGSGGEGKPIEVNPPAPHSQD